LLDGRRWMAAAGQALLDSCCWSIFGRVENPLGPFENPREVMPMIKVSVLYPNKPGSHFDMNYYVAKHMPLAMRLLNKGLRKTEVDAGIQGTAPGEPPAFHGGCQFYFDSIEAFADAWGPAAKEIQADIPRYTDVAPVIQFNELKLST
jgi:uncharacterized protein (TIGR02118 family)